MNSRMTRPGAGRPTATGGWAPTLRPDRRPTEAPMVDSRQPDPLAGFFEDDPLGQPAMPMPDLPADPAGMAPPMQTGYTGYASTGSTAPVARRQTLVDRRQATPVDGDGQRASTGGRAGRPIAGGGPDAQTASMAPAPAGRDRRPARPRSQSDSLSSGMAPVPPAVGREAVPPAAAAPSALDEDPQYREFLAWKQAQANAQAAASLGPSSPAAAGAQAAGMYAAPAASGHDATAAGALNNAGSRGGRRRSASPNVRPAGAPETASATANQLESADGAFTPFHYPGYDGPGYPKGLGHGPIVTRRNIKTGKLVSIEGIAWEEFPESWRQMLDEKPYDDAGALRVFLKATSGVTSNYPYYEVGSAAHASKFLNEMRSKRALIHNGADLSYSSRPQLDASLWR